MIVTENVEQAQITSNKTETQPAPASSVIHKPSKVSSVLAIVSFLLVLIAIVAIGGIAWKGFELTQQVAQFSQQADKATDMNVQLTDQLEQVQQQAQQQSVQLKQTSLRLAQLPGADRNDWLLAEAEYLLRLANQRLDLEKDWQGSLAILGAADKVLAEAENPLLNPVRKLLAQERQTLRAVPAVDVTGAVARLQAPQGQIEKLEWMPRTLEKEEKAVAPIESEEESNMWQKFVQKAWAGIGVVIRIREHETALPAPLTPDQHYYLQQNMHLMLEQAQVALVRQQTELYQQSLKRTQAWLDEFVMVDNAQTLAAKETLNELQAWDVSPEFPVISGSLNSLRQLLDQQRRDRSVPATAQSNLAN